MPQACYISFHLLNATALPRHKYIAVSVRQAKNKKKSTLNILKFLGVFGGRKIARGNFYVPIRNVYHMQNSPNHAPFLCQVV